MKIQEARFHVLHRGELWIVAYKHLESGQADKVAIVPPASHAGDDLIVRDNTHGRWKPCQTHSFELVKLALRKPVTEQTKQRLAARPKPQSLKVFGGGKRRGRRARS